LKKLLNDQFASVNEVYDYERAGKDA